MVSVLMNNYNYGKFLVEAIESVRDQTYTDWELIIVDDGSTDESVSIIEGYAKKYPDKIKAVIKENGGQASCFNAGFAESKGDIIAFLDSDDFWFPQKLERIVELHKTYPFVAHAKFYSNGFQEKISTAMSDRRTEFLRKYALFPTYNITTSTMSGSRDLIERILPMPEQEFKICADHFVTFSAQYYYNIKYTYEKLSYYRIHGDNAFVSMSQEARAEFCGSRLDYVCIEYLNKKLINMGRNLPLVPHRSRRTLLEMWKEIGEGFEIQEGKHYAVYGAAGSAVSMAAAIVDEGGIIDVFCDSDRNKWGHTYFSKPIISPEELVKRRKDFYKIIIASLYYEEIDSTLSKMGLSRGKDYIYTPIL